MPRPVAIRSSCARPLCCATLLALTAVPAGAGDAPEIRYPETRRVEQVDVYHGVEVPDPYRWLETDVRESEDVRDWVEAQNEVTFGFLESIPERPAIRDRLTELWNYERYSAPFKKGGRYFFMKNDGLQDQSVLYTQRTLLEEPRLLLDPNEWSEDGTVALAGFSVSPDGHHAAFARAEAGSDWQVWRVLEIDSGEVLPDEIRWTKFTEVAWTQDGEGFFYARYPEAGEGEEYQAVAQDQKVYHHRLGTAQEEDVLVYERPHEPDVGFDLTVTEDGRYLVISGAKGTSGNLVLVDDLAEPYGMPVTLVGDLEHDYRFVANDGPVFYFVTDRGAPLRRLIAIDLRRPAAEHWREVVAEGENTLEAANLVGNLFVARYLQDAKTRGRLFSLDGEPVRDVELPGLGTADGFGGRRSDTETFYSFSSFATPPSIYRYDLVSGESTLLRQAAVDFDPDDYEVKQVFYTSKDGTRVPMFLAHRKGIELDGSNPTLLFGYGGFKISLTPSFSVSRLAWMEMGGVFALANLRGGGEYGEAWHEAGIKQNKQNVFDDFIAAAEWLIDNDYTRPERLAIQGGSNGGLLVGAAMTQRPELFGAALPAVGVMDMLRYDEFTAGRFWVDDYGSSGDPEEFRALYAYSPYHNLTDGTAYPATLVTTADTDDRVVPAHSFKFAARLQEAHAGEAPALIRIETRAGHGGGKPTSKQIEEVADEWAFLVTTLGMELPESFPAPEPAAASR
ncbi:MAG: prolyl oligopeptidase family serine peptidase [Thermoanaerobaculia bacterium]